ncbi:hypothetical protein JTE90_020150 [Oedothorax gibbosus]|uniref:W2 domain-containing protein n=1 Tax=Oedothorax gibbosus TaxID=931172 RepID=A0AAV6UB26_9ARAC|nr:hypothetical protein JTE90_020150 [Oedothorax gibbosus]
MVRMISWMQRFVYNSLHCSKKMRGELTLEEVQEAEGKLLRCIQKECFQNEGAKVLEKMQTFKDDKGTIRIRTKLLHGDETNEFKFPVVLPGKHTIVRRMVYHEHCLLQHAGSGILISNLRERFWIIRLRRVAKSVISHCVICKRFKSNPVEPPFAPLPNDRIKNAAVFEVTGANCKLARQQLKTRTALLKHYIKHNEKYELQALYAIQVLMNQLGQPCGLLSQIFGILYDNNVISGKTFRIWEFSTDPDESEGRDAAVLSVRSFFIQLRTKEQLKLLTKKESRSEDKKKIYDKTFTNNTTGGYLKGFLKRKTKKPDQWSPLNPEGKKQYDRDFLLQFLGQPMSLCKPTNLLNLDVIKDKTHIQRLTEVNRVIPHCVPSPRRPDQWSWRVCKKFFLRSEEYFPQKLESGIDFFVCKWEASVSPTPVTVAPVPTIPAPVERMPSPVPIVDSDILATIPFPEESENLPPQNDISPSDPTSEASSVSPSAESEDKENFSDDPSIIVLKYSFKEDQWSPLNPEGKKQYDRDFLLQFQGQPMSLCKSTNLPNLDVIKDKAHIRKLTEVNRVVPPIIPQVRYNDPFMPQYARTGAPRLPHPPFNRCSQQGRGGEKPRKIISFSSLTQNIKLHESDNAWKPLNKLSLSDIAADDLEKEMLKRSVQGVLNKLTPQKFETLLAQIKGLNIDTEEKLNIVIDLIYENAMFGPLFLVPYSNMCKHLSIIKVPVADQGGGQVNFRKLLLTKCQKDFEQDRSDVLKNEERMKTLEEAEPDKQKEMTLEFDLEEKKMRYRRLGNIM